ncbi:MAG: GDP-mannose 4,6-dehydratase [Hydrogenovibrio sp.]|uniref:NAD-dependent epimerase/dehydratase family protein n=1 Tax=Hydrogenovibrio sp. TaxID=2065821 RepID=UPI0028700688|nr:NAD-dependent epimerase/dehydratase family protein [Hydrogenovibrio sp.]MDR9499962.1 GDP-mannose 4,6-dehydratase [Hydrogenovibrio sp.]
MAFRSNKRVLITGIDGFTGQYLSEALRKDGYEVYGTSLRCEDVPYVYRCNLLDSARIQEVVDRVLPDYVIHLAGISFVGHGVKSDFYNVNCLGTENLLESLTGMADRLEKVILASSATVYGRVSGQAVLDESLCPMPENHYGISKLAMERIAGTFSDVLPIVVARPFNYIGHGQPDCFVVPKIVHHFKERCQKIELGNINVEREFNSIYWVCDVYKQLMRSELTGVVNVCSGVGVSLKRLIEMMEAIAGYAIEVNVNPDFVRKNDPEKLVGSSNKLSRYVDLDTSQHEQALYEVLKDMYVS